MLKNGAGHKTEHIDFLDSLRGLAALQVVLTHSLGLFEDFYTAKYHGPVTDPVVRFLTYSPFHLLWDGTEAVIFFFVLSGFVLALPYVQGNAPVYCSYLVKRVCRIYLPYLGIVALSSVLLLFNLGHHVVPGAAAHFTHEWEKPVSFREAVKLLFMGGNSQNVDKVVWSLVYEMKISAFFPLLAWIALRLGLRANMGVALFGAAAAAVFHHFLDGQGFWRGIDFVYYVPFFIFGIVTAKYRMVISRALGIWRPWQKALFVLGCLFLYNWQWEIWGLPLFRGWDEVVAVFAVGVGSTGLIAAALSFRKLQKVLEHPVWLWLGKRSYSLYLVHAVVLLVFVHYLPWSLPLWVRVALGALASVPAAGLSYRWMEIPCQSLGYRLGKKVQMYFKKA